jgi:hypothetical protein
VRRGLRQRYFDGPQAQEQPNEDQRDLRDRAEAEAVGRVHALRCREVRSQRDGQQGQLSVAFGQQRCGHDRQQKSQIPCSEEREWLDFGAVRGERWARLSGMGARVDDVERGQSIWQQRVVWPD